MAGTLKHRFPASSARYALVCLLGLAAFGALGFYPSYRELRALRSRACQLQVEIRRQEIMRPLYKKLVEKTRRQREKALPFPKQTRLPREQADDLTPLFTRLAQQAGLVLLRVIPDVDSLAETPGRLSVDVTLKGPFNALRDYIVRLGGLPYLEHIEEVRIQAARLQREMTLRVWLAITG